MPTIDGIHSLVACPRNAKNAMIRQRAMMVSAHRKAIHSIAQPIGSVPLSVLCSVSLKAKTVSYMVSSRKRL